MDINEICKKLEQEYKCSAVNFYKYNNSYVIKGLDKTKETASFKYFIVKSTKNNEMDSINEIKDKVLIDYFSKDENKPSDVIY